MEDLLEAGEAEAALRSLAGRVTGDGACDEGEREDMLVEAISRLISTGERSNSVDGLTGSGEGVASGVSQL